MPTRLGSSLVETGPGGAYEFTKRDTSSRSFARSRRFGNADIIGKGTYGSNPPLSITSLPLNYNTPQGGAVPVGGSARINARKQVIDIHLTAPYNKVRQEIPPVVPPFVGADDNNLTYAYGGGQNAEYIEQESTNPIANKLDISRQEFYTYSRLNQRDRVLHKYEHTDERHEHHHVVPHYVKTELPDYNVPVFNDRENECTCPPAETKIYVVGCDGARPFSGDVSQFNSYMAQRCGNPAENLDDLNLKVGETFPMVEKRDCDTPDSGITNMGLTKEQRREINLMHHNEPTPPLINLVLKNHTVWEGMSVKFIIQASGNPQPSITWFHQMVPIEPELHDPNKYTITEKGGVYTLTINRVTTKDGGVYRALVQNHRGATDSYGYLNVRRYDESRFGYYDIKSGYNLRKPMDYPDVQQLNVPGYPRFITRLSNTTVFERDAVTLACRVDGRPAPDVFWTLNGREVKHIPNHIEISFDKKTGITSLSILRAHTDDEGEYVCRAYNRDGASVSKAFLFVKGRNGPPSAPADLECLSKDSTHLMLRWRQSAYKGHFNPPPVDGYLIEYCAVGSVMWKTYNPDNYTQLMQYPVTNLNQDTAWFFRVRAVNAWGRSPPSRPIGPCVYRDPGQPRTEIELEDPIKFMIAPEADEIWIEEEEPECTPGVPSDLKVEYISEGTIAISFNEPRDPEQDLSVRPEWRKPNPERSEVIDGYLILYALADSERWIPANLDMLEHCEDPYPISGLNENMEYKFRVIAVNAFGRSDPAESENILVAAPVPEEPEVTEEEVAEVAEATEETVEAEQSTEEAIEQIVQEESQIEQLEQIEAEPVPVKTVKPASEFKRKPYRGPPMEPQEVDFRKSFRDFIEVCWMPPTHSGGENVSYYVEKSKLGSGTWSMCNQVATKFTQFVCNGCEVGTSSWSSPSQPIPAYDGIKPPAYFGPVQSFMRVALENGKPMVTKNSIKVCWEEPQRDNGGTVLGYHLEMRPVGGKFRPINNRGLQQRHFTIDSGLVENEGYQFRVRAFNIAGCSAWIYLPGSIIARDPRVPTEPRRPWITGLGDDWCTMKWDAPLDFGDGDMVGYLIEKRKENSDLWLPVNKHPEMCQQLRYKADALVTGNTYFFRIFAVNQFGRSRPSIQSCFVTPGEPWREVEIRQNAMYADIKRREEEEAEAERLRLEREKAEPFTARLEDWWGESGQQAHFQCEVKDASWEVKWYFGNDCEEEIIPGGKYNIISVGKVRKLIINDLNEDDVKVVNCVCFGVNSNADLMVDNVAPAHFIERLYDQDLPKGSDCTMRITLTQDICNIKWYKHGPVAGQKTEITLDMIGEHIEIINQGHTRCVILRGLTYDDIGVYTAEGPNGVSTCALSVDGFHPIGFEKGLEDILYVKHTEQYIQFEAIIIPSHKDQYKQPDMVWLYDDRPGYHTRDGRDGREVNFEDEQLGGRVQIVANGNMRSLRIESPRWDDSGRFTLYHPGGFTTALLKVLPPPPPPAPPLPCPEDTILHFRKGLRAEHKIGGARLYTEVENLPEDIIITWTKNGKEIVEDENHHLHVDFDTGVVAVEIDNITAMDAGRYQAAFVTPLGMFDTRVNYDFNGDLFKAIMRKALDLVEDEAELKRKKEQKLQEPQTQEIVVEEEDEEDEEDAEMLSCFKSPKIQYERQESGQLLLWIEISNKQENTRVKWYKNGEFVNDEPCSEYHVGEEQVALFYPDFSVCSGEYTVELCEGSNSISSMLLDLTGPTFDSLFDREVEVEEQAAE